MKWKALLENWDSEMNSLSFAGISDPSFVSDSNNTLTAEENESLFYNYHHLHCEFLIFFEQCLMYSTFQLRKKLEGEERKDLEHFSQEEFYHTRSFRKYLVSERKFLYPKTKFLLRPELWARKLYIRVLRHEPWSILVPGAKSEIYFLQYFKHTLGSLSSSSCFYKKLNQLHSADEVHHIPFDFDVVNNMLATRKNFGHFRFWLWTTSLVFLNQFLVLSSFWRMIKTSLPERSWVFQARTFLKICHRQVRGPVYAETRKSLRSFFEKQTRKVFWFLRFNTW